MLPCTKLKLLYENVCLVNNILNVKLVCGLYSEIHNSKYKIIATKMYCILITICIALMIYLLCFQFSYINIYKDHMVFAFFCIAFTEHLFFMSVSLYTRDCSCLRFCSLIQISVKGFGLTNPLKCTSILLLYVYILFHALYPFYYSLFTKSFYLEVSFRLILIANVMIHAPAIITCQLFLERMILQRKLLLRHLCSLNRINVVLKHVLSYKMLLRNLQENCGAVIFIVST